MSLVYYTVDIKNCNSVASVSEQQTLAKLKGMWEVLEVIADSCSYYNPDICTVLSTFLDCSSGDILNRNKRMLTNKLI